MGNSKSKPKEKLNKNHTTKKGFQIGISFGKGDLTMEGNIQMGWTNKTVKNYTQVVGVENGGFVENVKEENVEHGGENVKEENVEQIGESGVENVKEENVEQIVENSVEKTIR